MNNSPLKFKTDNNKKYKINSIQKRVIYIRKLVTKYLLRLYFLVLWKDYSKKYIYIKAFINYLILSKSYHHLIKK